LSVFLFNCSAFFAWHGSCFVALHVSALLMFLKLRLKLKKSREVDWGVLLGGWGQGVMGQMLETAPFRCVHCSFMFRIAVLLHCISFSFCIAVIVCIALLRLLKLKIKLKKSKQCDANNNCNAK
jgi:hypothetical protein